MQAIVAVTLPFFALVLCGYVGARRAVLPEAAVPGLNAYVLYFALPCLLYRFGASVPLARLVDPALLGVYAASALLIIGFTVWATTRRGGVDLRDGAFGALVAAFPNSGFMGVPLLATLLGEHAAGPVIGTLLVDFFLTSTLCIALARSQHIEQVAPGVPEPANDSEEPLARDHRPARVLWPALRGALTNPLPWAIGLGAASGAWGVVLPAWIDTILKLLADSATPVALFTIGAVLWRAGQHAHTRTPWQRYVPVALIKLLVHPALVLGLGLLAGAAGAPVPAFGLTVMVLAAALPSASNVSLLAERYGADNGRVARIIMASTALAFLSFTALATVLLQYRGVH